MAILPDFKIFFYSVNVPHHRLSDAKLEPVRFVHAMVMPPFQPSTLILPAFRISVFTWHSFR
jgi:hypothetical protein